jgi:rhombotail lipoprotein
MRQSWLHAELQRALAQFIRFSSRKFVAEIVIIPDYYLRGQNGFEGLEGVQRLYGVDLMALVSYDQVVHTDENIWSLGYLTIVGAYVLKGSRHDVSTLVDLAVVDPVSRSGSGGGAALDLPFILVLLTLITFRRFARFEGMTS